MILFLQFYLFNKDSYVGSIFGVNLFISSTGLHSAALLRHLLRSRNKAAHKLLLLSFRDFIAKINNTAHLPITEHQLAQQKNNPSAYVKQHHLVIFATTTVCLLVSTQEAKFFFFSTNIIRGLKKAREHPQF